jgi:glycine dehydrogenase subunit 1
MFLETLGHDGLREMALQNVHKARYAAGVLGRIAGVKRRLSGPVFNEFVLELPKDVAAVNARLKAQGVIGGLELRPFYPELGNSALFCVTEAHTREDIDRLAGLMEEALR